MNFSSGNTPFSQDKHRTLRPPSPSLRSPDFDRWFEDDAWETQDVPGTPGEMPSFPSSQYSWHPMEKQLALKKCRELNYNRPATIRHFQKDPLFAKSVLGTLLTSAHLQYWVKLAHSTPEIKSGLQYVPRVPTSKHELPKDWEAQGHLFAYRLAWMMRTMKVPPELGIAFDHMGLQIFPIRGQTWAQHGATNVSSFGLDDKRQITGVLVDVMTGDVLGMELIFTGKTDRCLPDISLRREERFRRWHFTQTDNHWANQRTNLEMYENIIIPYTKTTKRTLGLPANHPYIVIHDFWPVQQTEVYYEEVKAIAPEVQHCNIPAKLTGKFQKADIDGGGIIKPKVVCIAEQYVAEKVQEQYDEGVDSADVKLDLRLGTLKNELTNWVGIAVEEFAEDKAARIREEDDVTEVEQAPDEDTDDVTEFPSGE
eukprot:gene17630-20999_t